jgi:hypothetical protein
MSQNNWNNEPSNQVNWWSLPNNNETGWSQTAWALKNQVKIRLELLFTL